MHRAYKLSELSGLPEAQRSEQLSEMVEATRRPPNGELVMLDKRIQKFEIKFGCTSDEMSRALQEGRLQENREICEWLGLITLRKDLAEFSARPH